jgi:hypothetical protein
MNPRALLAMLALSAIHAADPAIPDQELHPGSDFTVELPALGESRQSVDEHPPKPRMAAMRVRLPRNWDRARAHPVLCVYRGWNGSGNAFEDWAKVLDGHDFIELSVDFSAGGGDPGFANMFTALKQLEKSMAIDSTSLVVAGDGGGAWMIASQIGGDRVFCAAVVIGGGDVFDARALAGRPLLVGVEADDQNKDPNRSDTNAEREQALYEGLLHGGANVETLRIRDWSWADPYGARLRDWLHRAVPNAEVRRAWLLERELTLALDEERRQWLALQLASSWVEMPGSAEARRRVGSAAK